MKELTPGIYHLKSRIEIHASVEVCYQSWVDTPQLSAAMHRVADFEYVSKSVQGGPMPVQITGTTDRAVFNAMLSRQDVVPSAQVKHWVFVGPGGKLYEIENTTVLEIPNRFYCSTSTDPKDFSIQSSILFSPDGNNRNTLVEWQISFWASSDTDTQTPTGHASHFFTDILASDDNFMDDCLKDFKTLVETRNRPTENEA